MRILEQVAAAPRRAVNVRRIASLTDAPARFIAREAAVRARGTGAAGRQHDTYAFDGFGPVALRHGTLDVNLCFDQLVRREYAVPHEVRRALDALGRPLTVVDLGANIGLFSVVITTEFPVGELVAYEPDPENARLLGANLATRGEVVGRSIRQACAGTADGSVRFSAGQFGHSQVVMEGDDPAGSIELPVLDVFRDLADVDLLKLDIEGSEWPLLADARFDSVPATALLMEYHPWGEVGDDPRATVVGRLERLGYRVRVIREYPEGRGELWAWRP